MFNFFIRRLSAALFMILIASTLVFSIVHMLPGDPVVLLLGESASTDSEAVQKIRRELNLDRPLPVQYYEWAKGVLHFDLGVSLQTGVPVMEELRRRIPRSLELIFLGLLLATLAGIPLGIFGARRADSPIGSLPSVVAIIGFSSPVFVTGIILIITFSLSLKLLPSSGYVSFFQDPPVHLQYVVLPSVALGFGFMGVVIRMTRASFLDTLRKDYVRTARSKGLAERTVIYRHTLWNSLVPVIAVIGVRAGNLLGGTVIVETLFNWPGLSSLLVRSCYDRDYPVIQGCLIAIFVMFVFISLLVDLFQGILDPKLRHGRG